MILFFNHLFVDYFLARTTFYYFFVFFRIFSRFSRSFVHVFCLRCLRGYPWQPEIDQTWKAAERENLKPNKAAGNRRQNTYVLWQGGVQHTCIMKIWEAKRTVYIHIIWGFWTKLRNTYVLRVSPKKAKHTIITQNNTFIRHTYFIFLVQEAPKYVCMMTSRG